MNGRRSRSIHAQLESKRECAVLRDLIDRLLQAYERVARREYDGFLERGPKPGGGLED
jgi:hypothetical protein